MDIDSEEGVISNVDAEAVAASVELNESQRLYDEATSAVDELKNSASPILEKQRSLKEQLKENNVDLSATFVRP